MANDIEKLNKKMRELRDKIDTTRLALSMARKSKNKNSMLRADMLNRTCQKLETQYNAVSEQFYNRLSSDGDYLYNKYRK